MGFADIIKKASKKSLGKSRKSFGKINKRISFGIGGNLGGISTSLTSIGQLIGSGIGGSLGSIGGSLSNITNLVPTSVNLDDLIEVLKGIPKNGFKAILDVIKDQGIDIAAIMKVFRNKFEGIELKTSSRPTQIAIFKYINDLMSLLAGMRPFAVQEGEANFIDYEKDSEYYVVIQTIILVLFGVKLFMGNFAKYLNYPYDTYLRELYKLEKLSLTDYIVLRRRKLIKGTTRDRMVSYLGYDEEALRHASDSLKYFPSTGELIDFAVKEAFEPDDKLFIHGANAIPEPFIEFGKQAFMSEDWIKRHWHIHWRLLGTGQVLEAWHRGLMTEPAMFDYLRRLDFTENDRRIIKGMSFNLLTRVDVRRIYENGLMSTKELFDYYKTLGYSEKDSGLMTNLSRQIRFIETKDLRDLYIEQYDNGFLTEREIRKKLKATGLDPDEVDTFLWYTDSLKELDFKKELKKQVELRFYEGIIDFDELISQLRSLGVSNREIERVERNAKLFDFKKPRLPTIAELKRYVKKGLIDLSRFVYYALRLGYSVEIIEIMLKDIEVI